MIVGKHQRHTDDADDAVAAGGCAASAFFPIVFWSFWSFSSDEDISSTAGPAAFFFMVGIPYEMLGSYFKKHYQNKLRK